MDRIWTPWRFSYITADKDGVGCVLCKLIDADPQSDRSNLILLRRQDCFLVLNRFPYTAGHLMVVLRRHVGSLSSATPVELNEMMELARQSEDVLRRVYRPDGFNIGFNIGRSAGAGIEEHLHLHLVPRWVGDANFVSVVGETRVIPEELEATYGRLAPEFKIAQKR